MKRYERPQACPVRPGVRLIDTTGSAQLGLERVSCQSSGYIEQKDCIIAPSRRAVPLWQYPSMHDHSGTYSQP